METHEKRTGNCFSKWTPWAIVVLSTVEDCIASEKVTVILSKYSNTRCIVCRSYRLNGWCSCVSTPSRTTTRRTSRASPTGSCISGDWTLFHGSEIVAFITGWGAGAECQKTSNNYRKEQAYWLYLRWEELFDFLRSFFLEIGGENQHPCSLSS